MNLPTTAPPYPLDAPLPRALTGSGHGWFGRYRTYPVFGPAWARARFWRWSLVIGLLLGLLVAALASYRAQLPFPVSGLIDMSLSFLVPLALGPALGAWVRRRHWPPQREWRGLVGVVVASALAMVAFDQFGSDPLKDWIAARAGEVGPDGQPARMRLAIGVSLSAEPPKAQVAAGPVGEASDRASAPAPVAETTRQLAEPLVVKVLNLGVSFAMAMWMAGGMALPAYRRQREGLLALDREAALLSERARRREEMLRLSVLAAQVEPHFLFNTLAGVRGAIVSDPGRASGMVDRLVDYLRATIPRLRSDGTAEATLGRQLDQVRAYLALMAARMPRLQFSVDAPPSLLERPFPPLMLISLAENAVKHGVEPKIGAARIDVTARGLEDGRLEVGVVDDGVGFEGAIMGTGLGLRNIRERLEQLYGDRAALTLHSRAEGGVTASIVLPPDAPAEPQEG